MGTTATARGLTNRRSFLKSSAIVAAPIVAVAAPAAALADDGAAGRLARLEDERAIEAAHRAFLKTADAKELDGAKPARPGEAIRRIAPDAEADPPPVQFDEDGRSAKVRHPCTVELANHYEGDSTVEQMARLQGNAARSRTRPCVILAHYRKDGDAWTVASARMA